MGRSLIEQSGPFMCYNAANHWSMDWFPGQRLDLTTIPAAPRTATIAAFVDHLSTSDPVLVKVGGNVYVQYNRAKNYNDGTRAMSNQLVVVRDDRTTTGTTTLLAGLDESNPVYSDGAVQIRVCRTGTSGSADTVTLSIGQSSTDCGSAAGSASSSQGGSSLGSAPSPTSTTTTTTGGGTTNSGGSTAGWGGINGSNSYYNNNNNIYKNTGNGGTPSWTGGTTKVGGWTVTTTSSFKSSSSLVGQTAGTTSSWSLRGSSGYN
jgi:hypothetical protein